MDDDELIQALEPFRLTENQLKEADRELGIVTFINGTKPSGEEFYVYASIYPSKVEAFLIAQEGGDYELTEFGEIIEYGAGLTPPAYVIEYMQINYGIEVDFEVTLKQYLMDKLAVLSDKNNQKSAGDKESNLRNKYGIQKKSDKEDS